MTPSNPSLGITFLPAFPPESLVSYARQAEAAGFDTLWLYEDAFYAGGFTSAATVLAATHTLQVGIGLLPATVRSPLFAAMEITTLARLYPGRFLPGFGHGFAPWIKQIGAYPRSPLGALEETLTTVRALLAGHEVTLHGSHLHFDQVRLRLTPQHMPSLCVGGVRAKTLRLAGRLGDGALLSVPASPAYVRWADGQIAAGQAEFGARALHPLRLRHLQSRPAACRRPFRRPPLAGGGHPARRAAPRAFGHRRRSPAPDPAVRPGGGRAPHARFLGGCPLGFRLARTRRRSRRPVVRRRGRSGRADPRRTRPGQPGRHHSLSHAAAAPMNPARLLRSRRFRRALLTLFGLAFLAGLSGLALLLWLRNRPVTLPAPPGPYPVGRLEATWVDPARPDPFALWPAQTRSLDLVPGGPRACAARSFYRARALA